MAAKDLNLIRVNKRISKRMVATNYRMPWQFRIEMDGAPNNSDLFVKEITQDPITIETTPFNAGGKQISYPTSLQSVTLAATCFDNEEEDMYRWMEGRVNKVRNKDGTWNLPAEYLIRCKIFSKMSDGVSERLRQHMMMVPLSIGGLTDTFEGGGSIKEFSLTFTEFSTGTIEF